MGKRRILLAGLAALLSACLLPLVVTSNFWLDWLTLTLFLAVIGQGWNILGGYGGQFSFGHALFFGVGAYTQAILQTRYGFSPWIALGFSVFSGVAIGAFVGYLSFRYGLRGSYFALITLAFAEAFRVLATSAGFLTGGGQGIYLALNQEPAQSLALLQFSTGAGYYYFALILAALSTFIAWWLENSRFGAQLVAVRENEDAAEAIGVNVFRVKMLAILLSGAITSLGGVFYVQRFLLMDPGIAFGPAKSIEALVVPIVGGMGTALGPLLGSFFLHGISEATKELSSAVWGDRPGINLVFYGVVLVLMLAFLPKGLMGLLHSVWRAAKRRTWRA